MKRNTRKEKKKENKKHPYKKTRNDQTNQGGSKTV